MRAAITGATGLLGRNIAFETVPFGLESDTPFRSEMDQMRAASSALRRLSVEVV